MFNKGTITPALIVITGSFLVVIYGLLYLLSIQLSYSNRQIGSEAAVNMAEAGVNYYRWHLAHDPTDFTDGTGNPGPYEHEYTDPQGKALGRYSLEITPPSLGSSIVTITSTGWTYQFPKVRRTIVVQYGIPSFARYSFLSNASSWYGSGITVNGLIHSNNGIRMDGTNTSLVTSAQDEYMCGSETGCQPPTQRPGVWGSGGDQGLWQFPVPSIDFDSISLDLTNMLDSAVSDGLHLGSSGSRGYHLTFLDNGTVQVRRVTGTNDIRGYSTPGEGLGSEGNGGCRRLYQLITNENLIGTYNIADVPIIFAEDNLWVEGTVRGRITVVSATFPIQSSNVDIWIRGNLNYSTYDGSDVLGLISQNNIFFVRDIPTDFRVDGILMAQKGKIIRHGYYSSCTGNNTNSIRNSLTVNGGLINYYKSYWNFTSSGVLISGFTTRNINYDTHLLYAPPPYFPTSGEYEFISWKEE